MKVEAKTCDLASKRVKKFSERIHIGDVFGKWTVIGSPRGRRADAVCLCKCECGRVRDVLCRNILSGNSKSCGCAISCIGVYVGKTFGRWTVIGMPINVKGHYRCKCRCSCGTVKDVDCLSLVNGKSKSCRCGTIRNGVSTHPLYDVWKLMLYRCHGNVKNDTVRRRYKDRGISVCSEWRSDVASFVKWCLSHGWKKGLHIDRIDNDKGYSPDNCRFVTPSQNARNTSANTMITYKGKTQCIADWSEETGISQDLISQRFSSKGWSPERTFSQPVRKRIILSYEGITAPLGVIADAKGVARMTARNRYLRGLPLPLVFANRKLNESELKERRVQ